MVEIIRQVQQQVDMVILDTPPVLAVTDAVVLAARVDGIMVVARPGVTRMALLRQTVEQLRRVGGRVLGVVLNDVRLHRSRYDYNYKGYYGAYDYRYGESKRAPTKKPIEKPV